VAVANEVAARRLECTEAVARRKAGMAVGGSRMGAVVVFEAVLALAVGSAVVHREYCLESILGLPCWPSVSHDSVLCSLVYRGNCGVRDVLETLKR
jgi:hypothetical protein